MDMVLLILFIGLVSMMLSGQRIVAPVSWYEPFPKYGWRLTIVLVVTFMALLIIAINN